MVVDVAARGSVELRHRGRRLGMTVVACVDVWAEEFNSVTNFDAVGGNVVDLVTTIMLHSRAHVPASETVKGPAVAFLWSLLCDHLDAGWCERGCVVVELSVELSIRRESWIESISS